MSAIINACRESNPEAFNAVMADLLGNPRLRSELGGDGRRYIEADDSAAVTAKLLEVLYTRPVPRGSTASGLGQ